MVTLSLEIPYGKPASLLPLPALEIIPNNNNSATVSSPLANYVAGSNYPLSTTDNFSNGAFPPLTFPSDGFNVNDCDALGPDKNSDGDTSISSDSSNNESNDRDDGGGDKVRARPAEFPSAQP